MLLIRVLGLILVRIDKHKVHKLGASKESGIKNACERCATCRSMMKIKIIPNIIQSMRHSMSKSSKHMSLR